MAPRRGEQGTSDGASLTSCLLSVSICTGRKLIGAQTRREGARPPRGHLMDAVLR